MPGNGERLHPPRDTPALEIGYPFRVVARDQLLNIDCAGFCAASGRDFDISRVSRR
jgi:hypothetical protein